MEEDKIEIGKEPEKLKAKKVMVLDYKIEMQKNREEKEVGRKLTLFCKHPDKSETIEISKAKYEFNKKIKDAGLWFNPDKDGKIPFYSAIASVLRHYELNNISELVEMEIETTYDEESYLCIKAY